MTKTFPDRMQHENDDTPCRCDDCGTITRAGDLDMITDIQERITPGEIVPAGQCSCGALAYYEKPANYTAQGRLAALVAHVGGDVAALAIANRLLACRASRANGESHRRGAHDLPPAQHNGGLILMTSALKALIMALESIGGRGSSVEPEEEDYDDMESAYNNGLDVAYWDCAQIARKALAVYDKPPPVGNFIRDGYSFRQATLRPNGGPHWDVYPKGARDSWSVRCSIYPKGDGFEISPRNGVSDFRVAFDDAVAVAIEFAKAEDAKRGRT